MNLIDIEDRLKDLSDQQLMQQMQRPDGTAPQFLVMSELKRRKEMRDKAPAPETTTVKDDLVQQGIASVANQMAPQDGIPRFSNGFFPTFRNKPPLPRLMRRAMRSGADLSQSQSPYVPVPGYVDPGIGFDRLPPTYSGGPQMAGGTSQPGTYDSYRAQGFAETDDEGSGMGANSSRAIFDAAQTAESKDRLGDFAAEDQQAMGRNQAPPPASSNQFAGTSGRPNLLGGLNVVPRGTAMPGGVSGDYGEVNAATDLERMYNQVLSAPPSAAPAAPPTNYYEGIEKKLAALQEAETGPDVGMALLRAGLGIAQAGGEGKSTAAAIGAGGIAGLDAYEADKKAKQERQMQLMGVESQLAGAKTQQDYNQQKLALDARQRDIAEKGLRLRAMGQLSDNETRRYIANQTAALQQQRIALDQQTIGIKDRALDETIRNNKERIKAIIGRNEALADSKIAPYKFFLGLNEEDKNALLPFIQRSAGRTTASNLDKNTLQLFKEGGMQIEMDLARQFKEAGIDRPVTVQDVYAAAQQIVSGQRQAPPNLDPARILGGS